MRDLEPPKKKERHTVFKPQVTPIPSQISRVSDLANLATLKIFDPLFMSLVKRAYRLICERFVTILISVIKKNIFLKEEKNMGFIWSLIVGGILGAVAGMIVGKDVPGGIIGNIIVGFIGSWIGSSLLSDFGPVIGGFAIIPALIGAIVLIFIFSLIIGRRKG